MFTNWNTKKWSVRRSKQHQNEETSPSAENLNYWEREEERGW